MRSRFLRFALASFCMHTLCAQKAEQPFKLGVENISPTVLQWLSTQRVGLITNQTGRTQTGRQTVDVLQEHGVKVRALLAPEHGLDGTVVAAHDVHDTLDATRSIPIISLYGHGTGKRFSQQVLDSIDTFIFDIQDSGMRHYTYLSTLFYALEAAAQHKKGMVVLDRPNPLGRVVQGPLVDAHLKSFIAVAPIPLRHGMTVGELARYFNSTCFNHTINLHVVPLAGYQDRKELLQKCAMNMSPNIQTLDACYGYSFLGLLGEIRPFDVGIGTPLAFQCITLPQEMNMAPAFWATLRTSLAQHAIHSSNFSYYSTRKKKRMVGLKIRVDDIHAVCPCSLLAAIIATARKHGIAPTFSQAFDTAIGSKSARPSFDNSHAWSCFMQSVTDAVQTFCKQAQAACLYTPLPTCISYHSQGG